MTRGVTKLFITGANGNIGRALRKRLANDDSYAPFYVVGPGTADEDTSPAELRLDIASDDASTAIETSRPDAIVHLAGLTGAACNADPARAASINTWAVGALAAAAVRLGVPRFVLASTAAVYGDGYNSPVRENDPVHPTSTYARTKWEAEELLRQVAEGSGTLQSVALRIFNVFGDEFADSLVTRLVRSTPTAPVVLSGFDTFVRDYVHVDDVVSALVLSLNAPLTAPHSTFNIGSGVPVSNRDLVEHLELLRPLNYVLGEERISYSSANIERARHILGFEPAHALRT